MKVLAIDSNSILNRAFYGIRMLTTKAGEPTNGIYGFLNILLKMLEEIQPDVVVFAFDLKAKTFRHEMYAEYKGKRSAMPEELAAQFPVLKEIIGMMGYPIVAIEGYEADDIIGTITHLCREGGNSCVIATGDRDSFQLAHDGVSVRLATTKIGSSETEIITEETIKVKYGVNPLQLIDVKALMGDQSDNIPGVPGVGEKTALDLIQRFGSLEGVYENIDDPAIKKGVRQKLIDGKDLAYISRKLAQIDQHVPIGQSLEELRPAAPQQAALHARLNSLELRTLIKRMGLEGIPLPKPAEKSEEPAAAEIKLLPWAQVGELLSADKLYLSMEFHGREPVSYAVGAFVDGVFRASLGQKGDEGFDDVLGQILTGKAQLVCDSSKELYYYSFVKGFEIEGIVFDPAIGGYILNPIATSYEAEKLCFAYGIPLPTASENPWLGAVCCYPKLEELLLAQIEKNGQGELLREIELPLAKVLASMEHIGFELDTEGIKAYGEQINSELEEISARIFAYAGESFNINSPKQLGVILFEKLGLPTRKKTKTGYSTNADVLDSLKNKHPIIPQILEYRKLAKLYSTYVAGLLAVVGEDGRVHTSFRQTETRTGRISSTEPNMQNIPIRTERGSQLRRFFVAGEGKQLVDADYSQIELRVLAHISGDEAMIDAFRHNLDIHTKTAAEVFDLPEEFVTPIMRSRAKAVNFGIVYGIGAFSLSQDIGVTVAEADHYIKSYLATYPKVKQYMEDTIAYAKAHGYVKTMFERRRAIPEVNASNKVTAAMGERVAMNTPIQGSAADIIKIAMIRVYRRLNAEGLASRLLLQVHDELIVESPMEEVELVKALLTEEMSKAAVLAAPLLSEAHSGDNWLDAK